MKEDFQRITQHGNWGLFATQLLQDSKPSEEISQEFSTHWIVAGHKIREQLGDDRYLVRLLRHMLMPYKGGAVTLYRGENLARWQERSIGFAWTTDIKVARMFGSGLNAIDSGGVLLEGTFSSEAIISEPNAHSKWLGEEQFTVDPFYETIIREIEFFPPAF
ncbi:MAG: hypothetical protein ACTS2F_09825 [Thainema sp.]